MSATAGQMPNTRERQTESEVLAEQKLAAPDRLREDGVDGAPLDLLVDEPDADEDGDEDPEEERGREPHVHDDLRLLRGGEFAEEDGAARQDEDEEDEVVEDAVAHGLAEGVARDGRDAARRARAPPHGL